MAFRLKEHSDAHKFLIFGVIWRTRELIEQGQSNKENVKACEESVIQSQLRLFFHCIFP
jgi:hypothetical protein